MEEWLSGIQFERQGPLKRLLKHTVFNPLANYFPAAWLKAALRFSKSELAAANWSDPGGWRSMVISYDAACPQIADKLLVNAGTISMALRNRRRLGSRLIAHLIDAGPSDPVHVLCLGAGPGRIIMDAMKQARRPSRATLVDLSADAFDYGRQCASAAGLQERVRFIAGDVRDVGGMLDRPVDVAKMIGICEYLSDEQILSIAHALAAVMPAGSAVVFNSISPSHGTDRFFRRVFGLHMNHRSPRELEAIFAAAGFGEFFRSREPLGVYHMILGRRLNHAAKASPRHV